MASADQISCRNLGRQSWASAPTGRKGGPINHLGQRSVCVSGRKGWVWGAAEIIPKVSSNLGQSLSQPAADRSLYTREPWGRGFGTPGRRALRVVAESRRDCPGQRRTAERLRQRSQGNGRETEQKSPPRCPATSDNPSVSLRLTAPFAQGSLGGRKLRVATSLCSSQ